MSKLKIFLILIFVEMNVYSQFNSFSKCDSCATLTGIVVDKETQKPIESAFITILPTEISILTDNDGQYVINIAPGVYRMKISTIIGYFEETIDSVTFGANELKNVKVELLNWESGLALTADEDIKKGDIKILIGGYPSLCPGIEEINEICKEFGFKYEIMGCSFFWGKKYNQVVYKYLDSLNGEGWREKCEEKMTESCLKQRPNLKENYKEHRIKLYSTEN